MAQERLNGRLYLVHEGRALKYREVQEAPRKASVPVKELSKKNVTPFVKMEHPWKAGSYRLMMDEKAMKAA